MQWESLERETLALIGIAGSMRAAGADVDIPSLADTKAVFDQWLMSPAVEETDDIMIRRALGIRER